ncbi:hypothetical protein PsorP6_010698 [Peronosclerospora sorghi]|uniref:Uncharacterized protein n=1 Tax=Peronosclerospora sorghi TaxID=230839 RepID=A0ACC0VYH3_9STRA|nr:hypothetical protein PsorP6_010698 [Peronosclerospora sorghi]
MQYVPENDQFLIALSRGISQLGTYCISKLTSPEQLGWRQLKKFLLDRKEQFEGCFESIDESTSELSIEPSGKITRNLQLCSTNWVKSLSEIFQPNSVNYTLTGTDWVEKNCVVFRPKSAACREVFFVATFDDCGSMEYV